MCSEQTLNKYIDRLSLPEDAFERDDEERDSKFYKVDRFVDHLDITARSTVARIIEMLNVDDRPVVLDLMASWNSHFPAASSTWEAVGLGLNRAELEANASLTSYVIHDLNTDPSLPFDDSLFDMVINCVSVEYLVRPFKVFAEVSRVLKPGGLFLVIFSDRMFPEKAIKLWRMSNEQERVWFIEDLFESSGMFEKPELFVSKGLPRPPDDRYSDLGVPSDPVWAVYAEKKGRPAEKKKRPRVQVDLSRSFDPEEIERRKNRVSQTLRCPYCDERLSRWEVPQNPFNEWPSEFMYVCFNEQCPYLLGSWDSMNSQGNPGFSYRLMYVPEQDLCTAAAIPPLGGARPKAVHEGE